MNYSESVQILEEIKKANNILVNCHRGPDSDSVGSAMALLRVLESLGKTVQVICPSEIPEDLKFLPDTNKVKKVDYATFDFSPYDLFIAIDSSNYTMITGSKELAMPSTIPFIVIDHHLSNTGYGKINLIDPKVTSTGELLFKIFHDWDIKLDSEMAEALLTGIIGDTGSFQYQNVGAETLEAAAELIKLGADKDKIIFNIYRNITFSEIKIWGKIIENMQVDELHRFVWTTIPGELSANYIGPDSLKEDTANLFLPIVKGTDFGFIIEERDGGAASVSFRSRSDFDVSKVAQEVGGGGHKAAAGARIEGIPFEEAVQKVLNAALKYAKTN